MQGPQVDHPVCGQQQLLSLDSRALGSMHTVRGKGALRGALQLKCRNTAERTQMQTEPSDLDTGRHMYTHSAHGEETEHTACEAVRRTA
jgi:hypothetical protein